MGEIKISSEDVVRYAHFIVGHPDAEVDARHLAATRAVLDGLTQDGRLLPPGGEVGEEWGFRSVPDLGRPTTERRPTRALAEQMVAHFNRVYATRNTYSGRAELLRRVRIVWPDGGEFIGPWSPVVSDSSEVPNAS